ncbi:hypothetical protein O181_014561 [Austropuccinia psidii MF-1]|uniref:Uncharacterized protein n=1 Tax=Austropuccinia psidii MF-1 TaxID=1389203 RepID=A0A9Q3C1Y8_9BASI|nr:hypothetical protein [Austropuccinia psidii MF-1]
MAPISNGYFNIPSGHPQDSSRLKDKFQSQILMTPSSNHWSFSFTVFLQGNTGSSFSRDFQGAVPKQFAKGQCSINPPWQQNSLNMVWIHQDLYFNHTPWEYHSTQFISQLGKVYTSSRSQYRPAVNLKESSSQHFTYTSLL